MGHEGLTPVSPAIRALHPQLHIVLYNQTQIMDITKIIRAEAPDCRNKWRGQDFLNTENVSHAVSKAVGQ